MLGERYIDRLDDILVDPGAWESAPRHGDRGRWDAIPESIRAAHVRLAESAAAFDWPVAPATLFLDYARTGNRSRYQGSVRDARRNALTELVFGECIEGGGRFLDNIIDGIWATCEESFWGVPAHLRGQQQEAGLPDVSDPIVDLFAAEAASLLAWTDYLLRDLLDAQSTLIRDRIRLEIDRRILTPALEKDFGWMGFNDRGRRPNNWSPWICSNWLTCVLLVEPDRDRRRAAVAKILRTLDRFLDPYPADGGCDEGPGYWNHAAGSVHDNLDILHTATDGAVDVYGEPLIRNMAAFLYRAQIGDGWVVNFADAAPRVRPVPTVIYGYGKRIGDPDMQSLGAWYAEEQRFATEGFTTRANLGRRLAALPLLDELLAAEPRQPLPERVWLPDTQVAIGRSQAGSTTGYFVAAKGGHNEESHNHNDIGNVVIYVDGAPLIVDIGVEEYTAKTFGPDRYDIWTMRSDHHTVPTVNGVEQRAGAEYRAEDLAFTERTRGFTFELEIGCAYPPDAGILTWKRTIDFDPESGIVIEDTFELDRADALQMTFITLSAPAEGKTGITLEPQPLADDRLSAAGTIAYPIADFDVRFDAYPLADVTFKRGNPWGEQLTRILLTARNPRPTGTWRWHIHR